MGIIGWILLGLAAGAVAKLMTPDRDQGGLLGTLALGMAGALIADFAATYADQNEKDHRASARV